MPGQGRPPTYERVEVWPISIVFTVDGNAAAKEVAMKRTLHTGQAPTTAEGVLRELQRMEDEGRTVLHVACDWRNLSGRFATNSLLLDHKAGVTGEVRLSLQYTIVTTAGGHGKLSGSARFDRPEPGVFIGTVSDLYSPKIYYLWRE